MRLKNGLSWPRILLNTGVLSCINKIILVPRFALEYHLSVLHISLEHFLVKFDRKVFIKKGNKAAYKD